MTLQPEPERHPVLRSKAPWKLNAESYILFVKLNELPKSAYDPLERAWADEEFGEFKGGVGAVMIVRYSDTPVGTYDELVLIPGNFSVPQPKDGPLKIPKSAYRVARIYVSQRPTMYNGRLNWNIPKHLARFSFSAPPTPAGQSPPSSLAVQVFPPGTADGDGTPAFFACTLKPWSWIPAIPVNSRYIPISTMHVQPPIPEPAGRQTAADFEIEAAPIDPYDISPKHEEAICVGTERWCGFDFGAKVPRVRGCWVEVHKTGEEGVDMEGSERYFPQGLKPWSVGGWMEDGVLEIGEPLEWKL